MPVPPDPSRRGAASSPASGVTGQPSDALDEGAFTTAVAKRLRLIAPHPGGAMTFSCPVEACGAAVRAEHLEAHVVDKSLHLAFVWMPFWDEARYVSEQASAWLAAGGGAREASDTGGKVSDIGEVKGGQLSKDADGEVQAVDRSHSMRSGVSAAEAAVYVTRTGEDESYKILQFLDGDRVRCPGKLCNAALRRVSLYGHVLSTSVHAGGKKPLPEGALEEIKRLFTATTRRNLIIKNSRGGLSGAPVDGAVRFDQKSAAGGRTAQALNRAEVGKDSALLAVFPAGQVQCPVCLSVLKARELAAHVVSSGGRHHEFVLSATMRSQIDQLADDDDDDDGDIAASASAPAAALDVHALPTRLGHLRLTYLDKERMICPFESCGVSLNICNFYQHATKSKKLHPPGSIFPRDLEAIRQLSRITTRSSYRKLHALGRVSSRSSPTREFDMKGIDGGRAAARVGLPPRSKGPLNHIPLADVPVHPKLEIDSNHVDCPACPARVLVRNLIRHLEDSSRCKKHVLAEKELHNGVSLYTGILVLHTAYQRDYRRRRDVAVAKEKAEDNVNAYVTAYRMAHGCFPPAPSKKRCASLPSVEDSADHVEGKRRRGLPVGNKEVSSLQSSASPVASIRAPTPVVDVHPVAENAASDVAASKLASFQPSLKLALKSVV